MRSLLSLALILLFTVIVAAKPERQGPAKEKPLPMLAGESNWGTVTQDGRKLTIVGNPIWSATGEIRADGKVLLLWTFNSDGRVAPGLYEIEGTDLRGRWNWGTEIEVLPDGSFKGMDMSDQVYRLKPPMPDL